jgi:hypothetical protein
VNRRLSCETAAKRLCPVCQRDPSTNEIEKGRLYNKAELEKKHLGDTAMGQDYPLGSSLFHGFNATYLRWLRNEHAMDFTAYGGFSKSNVKGKSQYVHKLTVYSHLYFASGLRATMWE